MATKKSRRRRKRSSHHHQSHGPNTVTLQPGEVPTDEELEAERRSLGGGGRRVKYDLAKKEDLRQREAPSHEGAGAREGREEGEDPRTSRTLPKQKLVFEILKARARKQGLMIGEGTLEIMPDGYGFLRSPEYSYIASPDDVYVSPSQIRRFGLRKGQEMRGLIRPPKETETYFALLRVEEINGRPRRRCRTCRPSRTSRRSTPRSASSSRRRPSVVETRVIDLVAPLGFGQRALIVAPPRTGKTVHPAEDDQGDRDQPPRRARSSCCSSTSARRR